MYFKIARNIFNIFIIFMMMQSLLFVETGWGAEYKPGTSENSRTIQIDKIAAVVEEEIITITDIDKAIQFYSFLRKKQETDNEFYNYVLEELINYKAVFLEYKNEIALEEEDYDIVQTSVILKQGSLENLTTLLHSFGMEWADFKVFIKEKVAYEMVLNKLLKVRISVSFNDIEAFYNKEYLPLQEQMGLTPKSLVEMAPQIENHLRKERIREDLSSWLADIRASLKIENKLKEEREPK
jgi:hypothetical protein